MSLPRVLTIAGSDSGGGAGIQADIKTITCLGGYAMSAITALTAQNTEGVFGIHDVPPEFVAQQIKLVLDDIGADAIKTGMLSNAGIIEAVAVCLSPANAGVGVGNRHGNDSHVPRVLPPTPGQARGWGAPLIIDPVMVAKGGAPLLQPDAVEALKTLLLPKAYLVTPNIPEAELLAGMKITSVDDMKKAAEKIAALGAQNVLVKGGHLEGETVVNVLLSPANAGVSGGNKHADDSNAARTSMPTPGQARGFSLFESPRIHTPHTHGTGCTLASAIATYIAKGESLKDAVEKAQEYVLEAIRHAPGLGHGHGPLGHNTGLNQEK